MTFKIGGVVSVEVGPAGQRPARILVLPVNPDQQITRDMRVTVVQTQDGIYTDDFGLGIQTLSLSGTTAWNSAQGRYNGAHVDGNTALKHLYYDIIEYYFEQENAHPMLMRIYDDAVGQAWEVKPIGKPTLKRTSSSPTTAFYTLDLVILRDMMGSTAAHKIVDPIVHTFSTPKTIKAHAKARIHAAVTKAQAVKQTKNPIVYVASGQTLWHIAQLYLPKNATNAETNAYVTQIAHFNHIANPNLIFVGERISIPPP